MKPLKILYDEYIDRRKLPEQKIPVEFFLPLKWVRTIKFNFTDWLKNWYPILLWVEMKQVER